MKQGLIGFIIGISLSISMAFAQTDMQFVKNSLTKIMISLQKIETALKVFPEINGGYTVKEFWHECRNGELWAVNQYGEVSLQSKCTPNEFNSRRN